MTGKDFLPVARALALAASEPEWRTSMGRSYYSAFHVARTLLDALGFQVPRAERAHKYLAFRLCNSGHAPAQEAGLELDALRDLRNQADYELRRPLRQELAAHGLQLADHIIGILELLSGEPIRTQVISAIRAYERDVLQEVTWRP